MDDKITAQGALDPSEGKTVNASGTKRIDWIDKLRAVAFFLVIVGHFNIPSELKLWIYSFHMTLFLFITGMTFNTDKIYKTGFFDYISRQAKRILVPYFWLQLFSIAVAYLRNELITGKNTPIPRYILGIFCSNANLVSSASLPSYYAVLLFFVLVGLWLVIKITKGNKGCMLFLLLALSSVSALTQRVHLPCHLNVVPTGMLLVFIGRLLMDAYMKHREKIHSMNKVLYTALSLALFVAGYFLSDYNGRISLFKNFYGKSYVFFVVCSIISSVAFIMLVLLIPSVKILSFIGQNTFFMLCMHYPLICVAEAFVTKECTKNPWFIAMGSVLCLTVLTFAVWICNKICPYLCGMPPKTEGVPFKLCKFFVIAAALFAPYIYIMENTVNMSSAVIAAVVFVFAVVIAERILTLFMPFMFCSKRKMKAHSDS